jgi:hypothetical protein
MAATHVCRDRFCILELEQRALGRCGVDPGRFTKHAICMLRLQKYGDLYIFGVIIMLPHYC